MKERIVKIIVFIFISLAISAFLCAQSVPRKVQKGQEAWRALKTAVTAFEMKDYGTAIEYAEKSRHIRMQDAQWQTYILESTLKKARVRRAGDDLDRVMPVLKELGLNDALEIINYHFDKIGSGYFKNSYAKVFEYIPVFSHYPEADFLLGRIYRLEGELEIALGYMKSAYEYSINLDVPMEKYDLLYNIADLSKDLGRYEDFEKYMLLVVKDCEQYNDHGFMKSLRRIIDGDTGESVDKFFLLYRCDNTLAMKALIELSEFYKEMGENEKTLRCTSLASIMAVTKLEDVIGQRMNDFEFHGLGHLLKLCERYPDIVEWGSRNNVWKLFCSFAESAGSNGKILFARKLLLVLSESEPEEYWRRYASEIIITNTVSD